MVATEYEEDSEEESGMDWDELEEEARKGTIIYAIEFFMCCTQWGCIVRLRCMHVL